MEQRLSLFRFGRHRPETPLAPDVVWADHEGSVSAGPAGASTSVPIIELRVTSAAS